MGTKCLLSISIISVLVSHIFCSNYKLFYENSCIFITLIGNKLILKAGTMQM